ncbi:GNAT family N-acetyltransferase [Nocardia anaemiae]|uniref:GNAT family N-acetyltransferase n=1 Tax=Nocardia anaemiae TaxID=263910 RepID=UPI0007A53367|nr:GNAT family N-acetyltransferase [Nocardia anaemiae]
MRIEITADAARFRSLTEPFLLRDPLRHTVITTGIANHLTGMQVDADRSRFLSVHDDDATVVGVAMRAAGRGVYLGELPAGSVVPVADALADVAADAGGVEGTTDDATEFAEHWGKRHGVGYREAYSTRLYRLADLNFPNVTGSARRATDSDVGLCVDWAEAMRRESGMPPPGLTAIAIRNRIATGRWWLWECDGEPVSLAAHQVPVFGWSRIGPVYTPPDQRGHGYASILTAHVSRTLRWRNLNVCLFADTANPTANHIYRTIGFQPVRDFTHYQFTPATTNS